MNSLELLRFAWTPSCLRLLLAAGSDSGPVQLHVWAWRAGLPRNHIKAAIVECERLGGLTQETRVEGLALFVQPVEFWRVTPMMEARDFAQAWHGVAQERLALVTEAAGLHEALGSVAEGKMGKGAEVPNIFRNPVVSPESGAFSAPMAPESGGFRDHVQDHDPVHDKTERPCLSHDHAAALRISEKPAGLKNGAQKDQARDIIATYLHGLTPDNQKRWEKRVHENAELVVFAVEEAAARRERVENLAAYANRVYLSRINLKVKVGA